MDIHWFQCVMIGCLFLPASFSGNDGQHCSDEGTETTRTNAGANTYNHDTDLDTRKPLIIAHRGASGMLPEHTLEAYQLAIDQGADVIECDLAVTRDLQLVCLHDGWLSTTTYSREVFPRERLRTYFIPDHDFPQNITDHFTLDFTLAELKTLRKKERFSHRNKWHDGKFQIPTLEEFIQIAQKNNNGVRKIGIAPEIKNPVFMNSHSVLLKANIKMHDLLLPILEKYGYLDKRDRCILQSFDHQTLEDLAKRTSLRLVYLFRKEKHEISLDDLKECAKYSYAIGPHKTHIIRTDQHNHIREKTNLVKNAHRMGLRVYPYTFRNDAEFLPWDYGKDSTYEILDFMQIGVDGYFTDFPLTVKRVIDENQIQPSSSCHRPIID